jgi:hypothetical protein
MIFVPKMEHGTHQYPNYFYISFVRPASLYRDECVCVCVCVCVYIYISDCVKTVYELPLLPNNTVIEVFVHKSGAVRSVDWIIIIRAPVWR